MKLMKLLECLETLETNSPALDVEITGIHNDTRKMKQGDMFVAISGAKEDGHDYIPKAVSMGASMIVAEHPLDESIPHVVVPDTKVALAKLASAMYGDPSKRLCMIGVTGTKGKTSTTHIIKGVLDGIDGVKAGLIGTNHIMIGQRELPSDRTTPDAVELQRTLSEMADGGCTHCVMEVSSHALVQSRTLGIEYDIAVFLNLQHEHLDYHKNMNDYFAAKSILFKQCKTAVINISNEWGVRLSERTGGLSFAANGNKADITVSNAQFPDGAVSFTAVTPLGQVPVCWNTPGAFSLENALASVAALYALNIPLEVISKGIERLSPIKGRMERVPAPVRYSIFIDYAHTPDSLENVLSTARKVVKGRLICLFGCGGDRDKSKRPMMGEVAGRLSDIAIVTSDNPRTEAPDAIISDILKGMKSKPVTITDRAEAIHYALSIATDGDMVMLCGKGHEDYQEINGQKKHMDEREIVNEYFRGKQTLA